MPAADAGNTDGGRERGRGCEKAIALVAGATAARSMVHSYLRHASAAPMLVEELGHDVRPLLGGPLLIRQDLSASPAPLRLLASPTRSFSPCGGPRQAPPFPTLWPPAAERAAAGLPRGTRGWACMPRSHDDLVGPVEHLHGAHGSGHAAPRPLYGALQAVPRAAAAQAANDLFLPRRIPRIAPDRAAAGRPLPAPAGTCSASTGCSDTAAARPPPRAPEHKPGLAPERARDPPPLPRRQL